MANQERDSYIYGVDHLGRVWYMNLQTKVNPHQSISLQQASQGPRPHWALLPNPSRIDIKRLSSRSGVVWGISSDHQIHVYIHKQDIPIRVREETYENQRWNPLGGFCDELLPTDRPHFSSMDGLEARPRNGVKLPSQDSWQWEADWQIENTFENQLLDPQGWTYSWDFPGQYFPEKQWKSCVRRRKWFRIRRFIGFNRWLRVEAIHPDHTQEPFTDVCVNTFGSSHEIRSVWAVSVLGQVYFRSGVTLTSPEGTGWEHIPIKKGLEACQITVAANGTPFVVSWTGSCLYRLGLTPHSLTGNGWVEANGPDGGLLQLSAGDASLWAVTRDKKCWVLKGEIPAATSKPGNPFEWSDIPGKMKSVSVSNSDQVVIAMGDEDSVIFARFGITDDQKHGQGWREAFPRVAWDTLSTASSEGSSGFQDMTDSNLAADTVSLDSIRPDFPQGLRLQEPGSDELEEVSLCWVDGGCISQLKSGMEADLEVGTWRDEILTELQSLRLTNSGFQYANAIEPEAGSTWNSTSAPARLLQHGQESTWIKGQIEIANNDTIVFHKDLTHTWYCGLRDVLSVFCTREISRSFTVRIRNPIEAGVADFITFKFENEKDFEEWHQVVTELSAKNPEDFNLSSLWLTTTHGELHSCGMLKMADSAVGADMVVPSDSGFSTHHSLIKGFLPGSTLTLDISVPATPSSFSLNLEGKSLIAFHFNPRFPESQVVRNSKRNGVWGTEERDGVFPFRPLNKYCVLVECTDTHFITTVSVQRKQFIFKYRHRVLPRFITNFSAGGEVSILGIRYDPKTGDDASQPEFVTRQVPGHFWKIEAAPNGHTWAVGFDSNVWVYTLNGKQGKKLAEQDYYHPVTDDQICYIYENQRWNPLTGFGSHGLPTDRSPWSDETGRVPLEKDTVKLLSSKWSWVADWELDYKVPGGVDKSGWQYAVDFPASYHSSKRFNDFVRRRRWKRTCRHSTSGPWLHVPGVQLVDLSIGMNEDCDWEVLGAAVNGDSVVRGGITPESPIGTHWDSVPSEKQFISVSGWFGQRPWAIGKDGFAYIRYAHNWQLLDRPKESPLKLVRVGSQGVWAVGTNNALYRRADIMSILPEGREWVMACGGVTQVSLGLGDEVWGLLKKGDVFQSTLARRVGISHNNPNGIGWENLAEGPWAHLSFTGAFTRNR